MISKENVIKEKYFQHYDKLCKRDIANKPTEYINKLKCSIKD